MDKPISVKKHFSTFSAYMTHILFTKESTENSDFVICVHHQIDIFGMVLFLMQDLDNINLISKGKEMVFCSVFLGVTL